MLKGIKYIKTEDKFILENWFCLTNVKLLFPLSVGWLITGKCNLNCLHCYWNEEELPRGIANLERLLVIAKKIVKAWIPRVSISWWEPTLVKDLWKVIDYLANNWISVVLSTNWLLVKENIHEYKKLRHIEISLDWSNKLIHEKLRPARNNINNVSYKNAIDAIKFCVKNKILTRVLTTLNVYNKDNLFEIWKMLIKLGVNEWHIWRVVKAWRARFVYDKLNGFDFDYGQISKLKKAFPSIKIQFNYPSKYSNYYMLILPDGSLTSQDNITGEK